MGRSVTRRALSLGVVAVVLVALGGVGGAVADSLVGSEEIRNQSIRSADISRDGVGKSEIRANAVGWYGELNDFTRAKITSLAGRDGAPGPAGPEGAEGPEGPEGPAGMLSSVINRDAIVVGPTGGGTVSTTSTCDSGEQIIGGAVNVIPDGAGTGLVSRPAVAGGDSPEDGGTFTRWFGQATVPQGNVLVVHAFCAVP